MVYKKKITLVDKNSKYAVSKQYKSRFSIPDEGDFEMSDESEILEESEVSEKSEVLENDNRNCPICYLNTIDSLIYPLCTPCGQVLKEMGQHCHSCLLPWYFLGISNLPPPHGWFPFGSTLTWYFLSSLYNSLQCVLPALTLETVS